MSVKVVALGSVKPGMDAAFVAFGLAARELAAARPEIIKTHAIDAA